LLEILTNLKYVLLMALRPEDLPSDTARLIEMVLSLDAENDRLRAVIGTFKDMVFGSRSEKLSAVVADQLALDLADLATDVTLPAAANDDHVPSKPPASPARRPSATSARCPSICRAASR
jgi:transposase